MRFAWMIVAVLAAWICTCSRANASDAYGSELFGRLPQGVLGAFSFDDAASLRNSELGATVRTWMREQGALAETRRAWGLLSRRLGVDGNEAFDGLLGGSTVLAFGRRDGGERVDWIVLAAIDSAMDVRLLQRTRAVPRKIAYGRPVLGLEEESFLLSTLPPLRDGRSVVALAPAGAEWLLLRTIAVSAGKNEALDGAVLRVAPTDAVVRGFWKPSGSGGLFGDLERWLWGPSERMQALAIWATAKGTTIEIGLCPAGGEPAAGPRTTPPSDGVLLDVVGPGSAIVSGVLDRAGLVGLVPEGARVTRRTGELLVRRGPDGIDLGARLPLEEPVAHALGLEGPPVGEEGQVRLRELSETRASRSIFGPRAQVAWTLLTHQPGHAELLLAVASGPVLGAGAEPTETESPAVQIVGQAIKRRSPMAGGLRGSARPSELWELLNAPSEATAGRDETDAGVASIAAMIDQASWAVDAGSNEVRGRIRLELRLLADR
ncbi:MAG: hypothetical protein RIE32_09065 [Phycisphaerales bacterium]